MSTIPLLTPEQMDAAAGLAVTYRPPGKELRNGESGAGAA